VKNLIAPSIKIALRLVLRLQSIRTKSAVPCVKKTRIDWRVSSLYVPPLLRDDSPAGGCIASGSPTQRGHPSATPDPETRSQGEDARGNTAVSMLGSVLGDTRRDAVSPFKKQGTGFCVP
jgi:hypothetical protein